jgi:hypothetical protein
LHSTLNPTLDTLARQPNGGTQRAQPWYCAVLFPPARDLLSALISAIPELPNSLLGLVTLMEAILGKDEKLQVSFAKISEVDILSVV